MVREVREPCLKARVRTVVSLISHGTESHQVHGSVSLSSTHLVPQFGRESGSQPISSSHSQRNRKAERRALFLAGERADSLCPPGSRDWRIRWSQKAYQKSIHSGPHYGFKRRSHSPLLPSHHPAPENHSAILLPRLSCSVF
ncbi:hypothetical protein PBY51_008841 [Eleginops maclovinus]|uniref:Uncharacterized protein n=1 Tax=Eleginops maclovinus TaxID=56733 RepID=A0AAN8AAV0_ELEMC|nr:hypothetical protein PBY51_008841 [Eleginops maclovinus]